MSNAQTDMNFKRAQQNELKLSDFRLNVSPSGQMKVWFAVRNIG